MVLVLLLSVIFAGIEFDRMLMVYTSMENSAAVGVRYAIVHGGSGGSGTGDPASGFTDTSKVVTAVKYFARLGFLDADKLNITVQYPASRFSYGSREQPWIAVVVTVVYPYEPLTWLPLTPTLRATSRGVIVF